MVDLNQLHSTLSPGRRYLLAIAVFLLALLLRFVLLPAHSDVTFVTFYSAIVITFYLCGTGPGVLVTGLSGWAADYFFLSPYFSFTLTREGMVSEVLFLTTACLIGILVRKLNAIHDALRMSERRYLNMLEDQTELICRFERDGTLSYVNNAYAHFFYQSQSALIAQKWQPDVFPEDLPKIYEKLGTLSPSNPVVVIENRVVGRDAKIRWVQFTNRAFYDAEGRLIETQAVGRDITELKEAEEATNAALHYSRSLIEASLDPLVTISAEGKITDVNKATEDVTGVHRSVLIGSDFADYFTEPDKARAGYQQVFSQGFVTDYPLAIRHVSDRVTDVLYNASVYRDDDGHVRGVFAAARDITERKKAESALRVAAIAFEAQEGMMVTDAKAVILHVNRAFSAITGYAEAEVLGKTPQILSSGRQDAAFYADLWDQLHTKGYWIGEIWNRRKNGEAYPELLAISAVKDLNGTTTNYVGTFNDITSRKTAADEIQHLAFYDSLTNLPNRRLLMDRLKQALLTSVRSGKAGALLYIDLDNFKSINDTLGHNIGDQLLQQVAKRLESCIREDDTAARLGGDEFVVMLEGLGHDAIDAASQAEMIANKILVAIRQPYQLPDREFHSTTSIGVVLFGQQGQSQDDLLKQADIAMYQAKVAGRNTLRFFDPKMQETLNARVALENELRHALDNREFVLYYQIQVDDANHPVGAEALIRWQHPDRGLMSPLEFIPLAEDTGLILPIGQWILETACGLIQEWARDALTRDLVLSINVSAKQFHQPHFVDQVQAAIEGYGIEPSRLKLELTESMLLDNVEEIIAKMKALKAFGIQFSLDDFGTGYSSLQYLKRLPIDQLKIDQSFVRDIVTDESDQAIVRTVIAMAQGLERSVIAEGVEADAQRALLIKQGCHLFQGYLFGKPIPLEQFEAQL